MSENSLDADRVRSLEADAILKYMDSDVKGLSVSEARVIIIWVIAVVAISENEQPLVHFSQVELIILEKSVEHKFCGKSGRSRNKRTIDHFLDSGNVLSPESKK